MLWKIFWECDIICSLAKFAQKIEILGKKRKENSAFFRKALQAMRQIVNARCV